MLTMPQFTKEAIEGIRRCFVLYVKMPKSRWVEIEKAELLTPEGDELFKALKDECRKKYMEYGDYAKEDDIDKIDFSTAATPGEISTNNQIDFEKILLNHAVKGEKGALKEEKIEWKIKI